MGAAYLNFTDDLPGQPGAMTQGRRFYHELVLTDSGSPINITGDTFTMDLSDSWGAAATVASFSTATSGITISNGAAGTFRIDVSGTATASIAAGTYVYQLSRLPAGVAANREDWLRGEIEVLAPAKAGA